MAQEDTVIATAEVQVGPTMKWGAIFGGWLVATAIAGMFYVFGLGIGFSAFDPYDPDMNAKAIGIGTAVWMVLTWAVSLFLGGMFASWFDGRNDETIGTLHGVTVWGLSVLATALIVALGVAQAVKGGAAVVGGAAKTAAAGAVAASQTGSGRNVAESAVTGLQGQLTQRLSQRRQGASFSQTPAPQTSAAPQRDAGTPQMDPQALAAVAQALIRGKPEDAKALLAIHTGMSQSEIDQTLQELSADVEKFKAQAKDAADAAARYASASMWIAFFEGLVGLIAAALGGWLGAGHVRHVHHLRRYPSFTGAA